MASADLNIVLKLIDEASAGIKQAMGELGKQSDGNTKKQTENNKKVEESVIKTKHSFTTLVLTVGTLIKAYNLLSRNVQQVIQVGRDMDSSFNKSFDNFDISVQRVQQRVAQSLIPTLKTALDFWSEFLNKNVGSTKNNGFADDLIKAQGSLEKLKASLSDLTAMQRAQGSSNLLDKAVADIQKRIQMEELNVQTLTKLSSTQKDLIKDQFDSNIEVAKGKKLLEDYSKELKNLDILFLSGSMSLDQYFSRLTSGHFQAIQQATEMSKFIQDLVRDINELKNVQLFAFKQIKQSTDTFTKGFGQAFGDMIVEGKNFGESMKQVFKDMASAFISEVARMIAQWLAFMALKAIGSFFGLGFHSGGVVTVSSQMSGAGQTLAQSGPGKFHSGGIIRAHSGLAVDEVPIIAQTGEGILSRRGMSNLGGPRALNALNNGGSGGGGVTVNVYYPKMSSMDEVKQLANALGMEIDSQLRYAS